MHPKEQVLPWSVHNGPQQGQCHFEKPEACGDEEEKNHPPLRATDPLHHRSNEPTNFSTIKKGANKNRKQTKKANALQNFVKSRNNEP